MGARYPDDYYGQRRVRFRSSWVLLSRRMIPRYPRGPLGNGTDFSISRKDNEISSKNPTQKTVPTKLWRTAKWWKKGRKSAKSNRGKHDCVTCTALRARRK